MRLVICLTSAHATSNRAVTSRSSPSAWRESPGEGAHRRCQSSPIPSPLATVNREPLNLPIPSHPTNPVPRPAGNQSTSNQQLSISPNMEPPQRKSSGIHSQESPQIHAVIAGEVYIFLRPPFDPTSVKHPIRVYSCLPRACGVHWTRCLPPARVFDPCL